MGQRNLHLIEQRFAALDRKGDEISSFYSPSARAGRPKHRFISVIVSASNTHTRKGAAGYARVQNEGEKEPLDELAGKGDVAKLEEDPGTRQANSRIAPSILTVGERVRRIIADDLNRRGARLKTNIQEFIVNRDTEQDSAKDTDELEEDILGLEPGWMKSTTDEILQNEQMFGPLFTNAFSTTTTEKRQETSYLTSPALPQQRPPRELQPSSPASPNASSGYSAQGSPAAVSTTRVTSSAEGRHTIDECLKDFVNAAPVRSKERLQRSAQRLRVQLERKHRFDLLGNPHRIAPPPGRPGRQPRVHLATKLPTMPNGRRLPLRLVPPEAQQLDLPDERIVHHAPTPLKAPSDPEPLIHTKEYYYLHIRIRHCDVSVTSWRFDVHVTDITFPECPMSHTFRGLRMSSSMYIVFHEPNNCVFSPVDDLNWVSRPIDLYRHTLRIEVVGVHPVRTKVIDTLVFYGEELTTPHTMGTCETAASSSSVGEQAKAAAPPVELEPDQVPEPHWGSARRGKGR